jgi:hypothetical protein
MKGTQFKIQGQLITANAGTITSTNITVRPGSGPCIGYRLIVQSNTIANLLDSTFSVLANSDVVSQNEALIKYSLLYNNVPFAVRFSPIPENSTVNVSITVPGAAALNINIELLFNQ